MAHKKAGSSSKNGRDSVGQRLGVKVGDGQLVPAGSIIVRQRGMTFLSGTGTGLGKDYTVDDRLREITYGAWERSDLVQVLDELARREGLSGIEEMANRKLKEREQSERRPRGLRADSAHT